MYILPLIANVKLINILSNIVYCVNYENRDIMILYYTVSMIQHY